MSTAKESRRTTLRRSAGTRKAALQGDGRAQRYIGHAYRWGQGVPQSYVDAAQWYRRAAERGDAVAQWYLADAYRKGRGVPQSYLEAVRWHLKVDESALRHCLPRLGWTSFVALLLALVVLTVGYSGR